MGFLAALRGAAASQKRQRGAIGVVVALLHALAFAGLLMTHIVDADLLKRPQETVLTLVSLPPLVAKPASPRSGRRAKRPEREPLPDYRWLSGPFARRGGRNAITIRIPRYVASGPPHCPSPLKPGSKEWERRCPWLAKAQKPAEDDGYEDFSLVPRDSPAFKKWEAELKKRNSPVEAPCSYVRTDPVTGTKSNMADLGCAAKQLFGR